VFFAGLFWFYEKRRKKEENAKSKMWDALFR
jgi:hypothetical protein